METVKWATFWIAISGFFLGMAFTNLLNDGSRLNIASIIINVASIILNALAIYVWCRNLFREFESRK